MEQALPDAFPVDCSQDDVGVSFVFEENTITAYKYNINIQGIICEVNYFNPRSGAGGLLTTKTQVISGTGRSSTKTTWVGVFYYSNMLIYAVLSSIQIF